MVFSVAGLGWSDDGYPDVRDTPAAPGPVAAHEWRHPILLRSVAVGILAARGAWWWGMLVSFSRHDEVRL